MWLNVQDISKHRYATDGGLQACHSPLQNSDVARNGAADERISAPGDQYFSFVAKE